MKDQVKKINEKLVKIEENNNINNKDLQNLQSGMIKVESPQKEIVESSPEKYRVINSYSNNGYQYNENSSTRNISNSSPSPPVKRYIPYS